MLEKIQVFQDQVLVQELYGEYLDWRFRQSNSLATTLVIAETVGSRRESALDIQQQDLVQLIGYWVLCLI